MLLEGTLLSDNLYRLFKQFENTFTLVVPNPPVLLKKVTKNAGNQRQRENWRTLHGDMLGPWSTAALPFLTAWLFDDTFVLYIQTLMTGGITPQRGVAHKLPTPFVLLELIIFLFPAFFFPYCMISIGNPVQVMPPATLVFNMFSEPVLDLWQYRRKEMQCKTRHIHFPWYFLCWLAGHFAAGATEWPSQLFLGNLCAQTPIHTAQRWPRPL